MLHLEWAWWGSIITVFCPDKMVRPAPMIRPIALLFVMLSQSAGAVTLDMPANARLQAEQTLPLASYTVPTGAFAAGQMPGIIAEGEVLRQAWQFDAPDLSTLQILRPCARNWRQMAIRSCLNATPITAAALIFALGSM